MPLTWVAEITPSRPFAAPPPAEVSLDGCVLTVRRGAAAQKLELGSSSDLAVTRHQWHMDDGTAVEIRSGKDRVCIGGRGAFFPDLPHELTAVDEPDLVMAGPAFEELHAALMRTLPEGSRAAQGGGVRRFLLWKIGEGGWTTLLAPLGVIAIGGASSQLPVPLPLHVALALGPIAGAVWLIARSERTAKRPALALTIDRDLVTVDHLRPAVSRLASGSLAAGKIEYGHWPTKGGPLDNPLVRLSLGAGAGQTLSVGSPRPWPGTRGSRRRSPTYLMGAAWWPAFVEAIASAARTRE